MSLKTSLWKVRSIPITPTLPDRTLTHSRYLQTGPRTRKSDHRPVPHTCGRRAGMTTTRATISRCS
jgi:hypothetical protein